VKRAVELSRRKKILLGIDHVRARGEKSHGYENRRSSSKGLSPGSLNPG